MVTVAEERFGADYGRGPFWTDRLCDLIERLTVAVEVLGWIEKARYDSERKSVGD